MVNYKQFLVPVTSFVLAVVLAMMAAPAKNAIARKFADPTGGPSECRSNVHSARGRARLRNFHIDIDHPAQSTGAVRTRTVVNYWGGIVSDGTPIQSENIVLFASDLQFSLTGTHADGSYASASGTYGLTPIDGFGREQFQHSGVQPKWNLEAQFHESADDIARYLRGAIRVHARQGDTLSYDSSYQFFGFMQTVASETYYAPLVVDQAPCDHDILHLPLVLQAIDGFGRTQGMIDN